MTDRDDHGGGGDDDPQLTSMRAVWLAMPDEEPPQRGLAELMAAARVKAEQMKADEAPEPTWWQRIAALLRRPPVLALATVLVLIGGGVLIGQRADELDVQPEHVSVPEVAQSAPARDTQVMAEPAAPEMTERVRARRELAQEPAKELATEPPRKVAKASPRGSAAPAAKSSAPAAKPSAPVAKAPARTPGRADNADTLEAIEAPGMVHGAQPGAAAGSPATGSPAFDSALVTEGRATSAPRVPRLITEAKAAASRGDCTVAAALLKRVAAEDEAAYRKAVASDAALKQCMVAAAQ